MAANLLQQLQNLTSPNLISKLSKKYDENHILLRKSIEAGMCTVLVGLHKKNEDENLYKEVLETVSNSEFYRKIEFENLMVESVNNTYSEEGQTSLGLIFTNKKSRISEMISNEICVKSETAYAVLNLSTMLIVSYINKQNLTFKELRSILEEEINEISKVIPQGLKIILGIPIIEEVIEEEEVYIQPSLKSTIIEFLSNSQNLLQKMKIKKLSVKLLP
jgi:hypothetical protein